MMDQTSVPLYETLIRHSQRHPVSLHVPGHKNGSLFPKIAKDLYGSLLTIDVTELTGLDDLHEPSGAIQIAETLLADFYGAKRSFFLINGTTVGNLSMVLSICGPNDEVLVQRNCHKSIMNALKLSGAKPIFIHAEIDESTEVPTFVDAAEIKKLLTKYPLVKGIIITNPNYYGMTFDLKEIIAEAHKRGIPVLVDEAHGAHFNLGASFPQSAIHAGADIVVHSAHKTLPAMTMGSYLHYNSNLVPLDRLTFYLRALQSSSPSPIMTDNKSL